MPSANQAEKPIRSDAYRLQTLRPLNCMVFILPMLLIFQLGAAIYGTNLLAPRDLHKLLKYFGASAVYLPGLFVVIVLLAQHLLHKDPWELHPRVFAGMFGESIIWMIPLVVMAQLSQRLVPHQAMAADPSIQDWLQKVMLAFGAGVYEEFLFRLVFISIVMLIFVDLMMIKQKDIVAVAGVIFGAVAFSLYHFSAAQMHWAGFPWGNFIFRWLAGVYLGGLYVFRGYGIAVGAHAFYNIYAAAEMTGNT